MRRGSWPALRRSASMAMNWILSSFRVGLPAQVRDEAKSYQLRQLLRLVERYNLQLEDGS